jgi:hypothetical protein
MGVAGLMFSCEMASSAGATVLIAPPVVGEQKVKEPNNWILIQTAPAHQDAAITADLTQLCLRWSDYLPGAQGRHPGPNFLALILR